MFGAGLQPRQVQTMGSHMSLAPTLLDMLGLKSPEPFAGASLLLEGDGSVPVEYGYHVGLLSRATLRVISKAGELKQWRVSLAHNRYVAEAVHPDDSGADVLGVFAPAYSWYYRTPR